MRRPGMASLVLGLASAVLVSVGLVAGSTLGAEAVLLASTGLAGVMVRLTEAEGFSASAVYAVGITGTGAVPGASLKTSAAGSGLASTAFAGATVLAIVAGLAASGAGPAALTGADGAAVAAGAVLAVSAAF